MISKERAIEILRREQVNFFPLGIRVVDLLPLGVKSSEDFELDVQWRSISHRFSVEYKRRSTPRMLDGAIQHLKGVKHLSKPSIIIMPYLSEDKMKTLAEHELCGLDLCGNYIIFVDDEWMLFRTGQPNLYPESQGIQNPFVGKSSLVPRALLLHSRYSRVSDIQVEIQTRGGNLTLGTVSKVLKVMDEQLLIHKDKGSVCVLQPEEIIDRLVKEFRKPAIEESIRGKIGIDKLAELIDKLQSFGWKDRYALLWFGNLSPYALMGRENELLLYAETREIVDVLEVDTNTRFPNVDIKITKDPLIYFDTRAWMYGTIFVSPIQTYLTLMAGDKRDQETALQVKEYILKELEKNEAA